MIIRLFIAILCFGAGILAMRNTGLDAPPEAKAFTPLSAAQRKKLIRSRRLIGLVLFLITGSQLSYFLLLYISTNWLIYGCAAILLVALAVYAIHAQQQKPFMKDHL